jgi:hypothetical protein
MLLLLSHSWIIALSLLPYWNLVVLKIFYMRMKQNFWLWLQNVIVQISQADNVVLIIVENHRLDSFIYLVDSSNITAKGLPHNCSVPVPMQIKVFMCKLMKERKQSSLWYQQPYMQKASRTVSINDHSPFIEQFTVQFGDTQ